MGLVCFWWMCVSVSSLWCAPVCVHGTGEGLKTEYRGSGLLPPYEYILDRQSFSKTLNPMKHPPPLFNSQNIKEEKERNKKKVFDLWLACHTQEEIAEIVGVTQPTIVNFIKSCQRQVFINFTFSEESFKPPIYNVWKTRLLGYLGKQ